MRLGDLFKATQNKALQERIVELEAMLTPEMRDLLAVQEKIATATQELNRITEECEKTISSAQKKADNITDSAEKRVANDTISRTSSGIQAKVTKRQKQPQTSVAMRRAILMERRLTM